MPVFRKHPEAPACSCRACADSGLVEAGLGASTPPRLPPLPRGSWAPSRTTSGGGPAPRGFLNVACPRYAGASLVPGLLWALGFGLLFIVLCLFVRSLLPVYAHFFIRFHSFIQNRAAAQRAGPEHTELASSPCSELGVWGQIT